MNNGFAEQGGVLMPWFQKWNQYIYIYENDMSAEEVRLGN
jgi:hypothetical protein